MTFLERYNNGETTEVYSDIAELGQTAFSKEYYSDIEAVVTETMKRTNHNLTVIYDELKRTNYNFKHNTQYSFEVPLNQPIVDAEESLAQLEMIVIPFGFVPLSLKLFYKIVGSCNFAWDFKTSKNISWKCSDPIQIIPLDTLVEQVTTEYWLEEMTENKETYNIAYLGLSADYLHKDNISGGPAYAMEITQKPSIDGKLLNEEHQTSFINYLRIVFENCGFGRTDDIEHTATFKSFCDKVEPKLRKI
jgi:hypothetical protein